MRRCMGEPQWAMDPRFDTLLGRKQHEDDLDALVAEWTSTQSADEVMTGLQAAGVPSGVVHNGEGLINDPQLDHRGHHVKLETSVKIILAELATGVMLSPKYQTIKTANVAPKISISG